MSNPPIILAAVASRERGFTLVELVTIIVILGVLAAVAFPRFINVSGDAERNAVAKLTGALESARQLSFAEMLVRSNGNPYYQGPGLVTIDDFVQCDSGPIRGPRPPLPPQSGQTPPDRTFGLAEIRSTLFLNPGEGPVCSRASGSSQIQFTAKSGRVITIVANVNTISWSANPPY